MCAGCLAGGVSGDLPDLPLAILCLPQGTQILVYLASSSLPASRELPLDLIEGKCFLFNLAHFSVGFSYLLRASILLPHLVSTPPLQPSLRHEFVVMILQ